MCWRSGWAGIPARLSTPCQVHQYNSNNSLNFRYKKAPSFLTRLRCIGGTAGLACQRDSRPRVRCTNTTPTTSLNFRYKKAPSLLTRLHCVGGTAGLALQRDSRPCVRCINTVPATSLNSRYKKAPSLLTRLRCVGGADGTRTRDPWRDRPVF